MRGPKKAWGIAVGFSVLAALVPAATAQTSGRSPAPDALAAAQASAPAKADTKLAGGLAALADPRRVAAQSATGLSLALPDTVAGGSVVVDVAASGDPSTLLADLKALGLTGGAVAGKLVSGRLPVSSLNAAGALTSARFVRPAAAMSHTGSVNSQGDAAMNSNALRAAAGVTGAGVTIGTLSDSYNCLGGAAAGVASNDLPLGVNVLDDTVCPGTDEGRGMMELIHDVAPGSAQAFHTAFGGQAAFAQGILDLAAAGSDIINDDIIFFAEPMFQDGVVAQAVDTVVGMGIPYFSSAGNQAADSYEQAFRPTGVVECAGGFAGEAHDFDPGAGVDTRQRITIPGGRTVIAFQWDQPFFSVSGFPGSANDMDICLYTTGGAFLGGGFDGNVGSDAVEVIAINNGGGPVQIDLALTRFDGAAPGKLKYVLFRSTASIDEFATNSSTSYGHNNAAGASATAAAFALQTPAFGVNPPVLEAFSSRGGTPILFNTAGAAIAPVLRQTPDITGPDGGNTTFFGTDSPADADAFPNFFGTSAAAPHVAALSALLFEFLGPLTPAALYSLLETTAIDMGPAGYDRDSGFGLVNVTFEDIICGGPPPPGAIVGTGGDDVITGTPGDDVIFGLGGRDRIAGLGGHDTICGGPGNDDLSGGEGNDVLIGGAGNDRHSGGAGNDRMVDTSGNDQFSGGDGDDTLIALDAAGGDALVGSGHVVGDVCMSDPTDTAVLCNP